MTDRDRIIASMSAIERRMYRAIGGVLRWNAFDEPASVAFQADEVKGMSAIEVRALGRARKGKPAMVAKVA